MLRAEILLAVLSQQLESGPPHVLGLTLWLLSKSFTSCIRVKSQRQARQNTNVAQVLRGETAARPLHNLSQW